MSTSERFTVRGVDRETSEDAEITIEAASEANARVKAELRGVVVTSVQALDAGCEDSGSATQSSKTAGPGPTADRASAEDGNPELAKLDNPASPAETGGVTRPPKRSNKRGAPFQSLAIGWTFAGLSALMAFGVWADPNHVRSPVLDVVAQSGFATTLVQAIGELIGLNLVGIAAFVLGLVAFLLKRRAGGVLLMLAALVSMAMFTAAQFQPTSA